MKEIKKMAMSLKDIQNYGDETNKVYLHIDDVRMLLDEQSKKMIEENIKFLKLKTSYGQINIAVNKIIAVTDYEVYTDKWQFNCEETEKEIMKKIKE